MRYLSILLLALLHGCAVLALAADGRLSLDDPIGRHLPQLVPPWSEVPVAHFLTHTAGLPAEIVNRAWPGHPMFEPVGREEFLASLAQFPPDHPPGAGFNYSNVGYLLPAWGAGRPVHGRVAGEDRGSYFDQPRLKDGLGWRIRAAGDLQAAPAESSGIPAATGCSLRTGRGCQTTTC